MGVNGFLAVNAMERARRSTDENVARPQLAKVLLVHGCRVTYSRKKARGMAMGASSVREHEPVTAGQSLGGNRLTYLRLGRGWGRRLRLRHSRRRRRRASRGVRRSGVPRQRLTQEKPLVDSHDAVAFVSRPGVVVAVLRIRHAASLLANPVRRRLGFQRSGVRMLAK